MHCVFCGAKQAPAPAVQPGLAKTAFGYSPEMMEQLKQSGGQAPRTSGGSQPPPYQQPPQAYQPPPAQGYAQGGLAPATHANAATVFVPGGGPPPAMLPTQQQPQPMPPVGAFAQTAPANPPVQPMGGMGVHSPNQMTPQALPQAPQPYGQAQSRAGRPIEPWKDTLPFLMLVWGVVMLAAFATPVSTNPLAFNWDAIIHGEGTAKIPMLIIAAVGLLGVIIGMIPMAPLPKGVLAAMLGLAGIVVPIVIVLVPPWQVFVPLVGLVTLVPGLLLRDEYVESLFARVLVTIGVICTLAPLLIPTNNEIPLVSIFKGLIDAPGQAKVAYILEIGLVVIVVMSLLAWMPGPATGGAKVFAWLIILYSLIQHVVTVLLAGHLADVVKGAPFTAVAAWVPETVCLIFVGYGLATVFGKQLE